MLLHFIKSFLSIKSGEGITCRPFFDIKKLLLQQFVISECDQIRIYLCRISCGMVIDLKDLKPTKNLFSFDDSAD